MINGFLLAELTLAGRNLPSRHPEMAWEKSLFWTAPLGEGVTRMRQLLAGNRLNLDAWQAFQEVNYGPFAEVRQLRVRFQLDPQAYLNLTYHRDARGRRGVRLSRHPGFASIYFESDREGRFVRMARLPCTPQASNRVLLEGTTLRLNESPPIQLPAVLGETLVSLGGGSFPTRVESLEINGQPQLFAHRQSWFRLGLVFTALLLLLVPVLGRLQLSLTPILLGLIAFDHSYWSGRYALNSPIERVRTAWCDLWEGLDPSPPEEHPQVVRLLDIRERGKRRSLALETYAWPDFRSRLVPDSLQGFAPRGPVVLFLGTSQLWGSGAQRREDRVVARLGPLLQNRWQVPFTLVNGSRWGSRCVDLEKRYRLDLARLRPSMVVLNLGHNDQDNPEFPAQLETLVQDCLPARVVLMCEANSGESPLAPALQRAHSVLRQTARRHHLLCLELDSALRRPQRLTHGIMWCDVVHLTSYGQACMAEYLAQGLPAPFQNQTP